MIEWVENRQQLAPLFEGYKWNYLVDSVLEGWTGRAWADVGQAPQVSFLEFPQLQLYIPGGEPDHPQVNPFLEGLPRPAALIFSSPVWEKKLKNTYGESLVELTRYAFTSEHLHRRHLQELAERVPAGFQPMRMNRSLAMRVAREESAFTSSHLLNFNSVDHFIQQGFGFCIMQGEEIASLATTFVVCQQGVEIQINTRDQHKGKGLATAVAARLVLHSLEEGLDPNWDAANEVSVRLARKLGYTFQETYRMYVLMED